MSKAVQQELQQSFVWPLPPFFRLEPKHEGQQGRIAEVELISGRRITGELLKLDVKSHTLLVADERAKNFRSLSLGDVRCARLLEPLEIVADGAALETIGPQSAVTDDVREFTLHYADGTTMTGQTHGFVRTHEGLFLFPVDADSGRTGSCFIPKVQVNDLHVGPLLGEMLEQKGLVNHEQKSGALRQQSRWRKERLGEYLQEQAIVSPQQLSRALREQRKLPHKRLGELLVEHGLITAAELRQALDFQAGHREQRLGEILVAMGVVALRDIQTVLAEKLGIPYVNVEAFSIQPDVLDIVGSTVATRHQVIPLFRSDGNLVVAVENPLEFDFEPELRFIANMNVVAVVGDPDAIRARIVREYGNWESMDPRSSAVVAAPDLQATRIEDLTDRLSHEARWLDDRDESLATEVRISDNTLVRLVNKMIIDAHQRRASDIHIEASRGAKIRVRYRIDGLLQDYLELQPVYGRALVSRIKVMSNLDISEHRHAQDGKIDFRRFGPLSIQLRVAIIPTSDGAEDVVLRLLGGAEPLPLDKLELGKDYLAQLQDMIRHNHGLILVCGPTGSGKTTTLHSILRHINRPERKIWTAEDPIEIAQPGLRQVQINARIGWTFAQAMRSFLRADPDVIMVGEMRDEETTSIGIEASLTGHLVFSTLHTNSAVESVVRLLEMGMDPFNFADALIGILSQRLAQRLCRHCKVPHKLSKAELEDLAREYCTATDLQTSDVMAQWRKQYGKSGRIQVYEARGCEKCDHGYHGRIGIFELLASSPEVRQLIRSQATVPQIQEAAMRNGLRLLRQDALNKALRGDIDLVSARAVSA